MRRRFTEYGETAEFQKNGRNLKEYGETVGSQKIFTSYDVLATVAPVTWSSSLSLVPKVARTSATPRFGPQPT